MNSVFNSIYYQEKKIISIVQLVFGYTIASFFGFILLALTSISDEENGFGALIIVLLFITGGVFLIISGHRNSKLNQLYREYSLMLSIDPLKSIDKLARFTGVPFEVAKKNVIRLLRNGYFSDCLIDYENNCLNIPHSGQLPTRNPYSTNENAISICRGCGTANTTIKGTNGKCENCGMQIQKIDDKKAY